MTGLNKQCQNQDSKPASCLLVLGPQTCREPVQPPPALTQGSQQLTSACPCRTWRSGRRPGGSTAQRRWG